MVSTPDAEEAGEEGPAPDTAAGEPTGNLDEQLQATRATLALLRQEISETSAKIDQLIERTDRVEEELGLLKKSINKSSKTINPKNEFTTKNEKK